MARSNKASRYATLALVSVLTFSLLGAAAMSAAKMASATPEVRLWAVPTKSLKADGMNQVVGVKAFLDNGNFVDSICVVVDEGTGEEKKYCFEGNGDDISSDPGFIDVFCKATFFSDGYAIGDAVIDCRLALDKDAFDVGTHPLKLYVNTDVGTFTKTSKFRLVTDPSVLSDLVNKEFTAPGSIGRGDIKPTFTKEKNEGDRGARGHWIKIYLSPDTSVDPQDKIVGKKWVSFLGKGKTKTHQIAVTVPSFYPLGPEKFISMVDAVNHVGEQDETNNKRTKSTTITT